MENLCRISGVETSHDSAELGTILTSTSFQLKPDSVGLFKLKRVYVGTAMRAEEVDILLQRSEGGVDSALTYAKTISKYMKDLIGYVEKRISFGKL